MHFIDALIEYEQKCAKQYLRTIELNNINEKDRILEIEKKYYDI